MKVFVLLVLSSWNHFVKPLPCTVVLGNELKVIYYYMTISWGVYVHIAGNKFAKLASFMFVW